MYNYKNATLHFIKAVLKQHLILFIFLSLSFAPSVFGATPPPQPEEGPGGTDYTHQDIISKSYGFGPSGYYIFEPDNPKPESAPLIVFVHGYSAYKPLYYQSWINHLVKRGNIIVFPNYQSFFTRSSHFIPNAISAITEAIEELQSGSHVEPELNNFAIVGHSCGGILTPNIAALAEESGLPTPRAIMAVEPARSSLFPFEDLSKIPSETLLLTVLGDADPIAEPKDAKKIFYDTPQIPFENKDYIVMPSDHNTVSSLSVDHYSPLCIPFMGGMFLSNWGANAIDFCLWRLFDALTDAAFYDINWEYALGNTPEQRDRGAWSDGTPVKELLVTDTP